MPAGADRRGSATSTEAEALPSIGVTAMWFIPLSITFSIRKTRTSWSVTVRVQIVA